VALFAVALIWLIALVTYEPADPAWFFHAGASNVPANFIGRVGAFLAELSFQLVGFASYLIPFLLAVLGWALFWCRALDAVYTKAVGVALVFGCASSLLNLVLGAVTISDRRIRAGGYFGEYLSAQLAEYFNRTGSTIVILTLLVLAVIMATQFSFGRLFTSAFQGVATAWTSLFKRLADWRDARRKEQQRREVIRKHTAQNPEEVKAVAAQEKRAAREQAARAAAPTPQPDPAPRSAGKDEEAAGSRATPAISRPLAAMAKRVKDAPPAAGTEFESRTPIERKKEGLRCRRSPCSTHRRASTRSTNAS
jgi:S-DNA-T family DNA segregation ATPase FtsK/SpoIIIE